MKENVNLAEICEDWFNFSVNDFMKGENEIHQRRRKTSTTKTSILAGTLLWQMVD